MNAKPFLEIDIDKETSRLSIYNLQDLPSFYFDFNGFGKRSNSYITAYVNMNTDDAKLLADTILVKLAEVKP